MRLDLIDLEIHGISGFVKPCAEQLINYAFTTLPHP